MHHTSRASVPDARDAAFDRPGKLTAEEGSTASPSQPTAVVIGRLLKQYEDGRQRQMARETEQIENDLATRTCATLTAATSTLTQHLGLDPFAPAPLCCVPKRTLIGTTVLDRARWREFVGILPQRARNVIRQHGAKGERSPGFAGFVLSNLHKRL